LAKEGAEGKEGSGTGGEEQQGHGASGKRGRGRKQAGVGGSCSLSPLRSWMVL
jgi:hypothetical protein